ncbi:MAG TPA: D-aminoacylase [Nocardioides sp.]|jgi:N-acyl-D-amino-acid deacylase|uniref:N-acyl-D-amino-acid deacylase family protein n=1 Tax=Nocardioides sp. TaxID=35761 RepID=UPI002E31EAE3|nr:D-aminoacylase [Nocardioides sp.]HEX3929360.1 D-aminoacylase [Nocardioides sp.]
MYDLILRGGQVLDGRGGEPRRTDVAVAGDRIVSVGDLPADEPAAASVDADGLVVCPGFVNPLSHSYLSVLEDGTSLGELVQGVTTQIFGEGDSMGPVPPDDRETLVREAAAYGVEVTWTRLSEYLDTVERAGCTQNVASLVGAATMRILGVGYDDRPATDDELDVMREVLAEEMADGALGIGSSLIYAPGSYASTAELVALCEVAGRVGGTYASHVRNEGAELLFAIEELLEIVRRSGVHGEMWHLKAAGETEWPLMAPALEMLQAARDDGLSVTADVYPYTWSGTGLSSNVPPHWHEGGPDALFDRLCDPDTRARIRAEMATIGRYGDTPDARNVLLLRLRHPDNARWQGHTLAEIADDRGHDPLDTALDILASERTSVFTAFHSMSEDNLRRQLAVPWVGVCSDAASIAPSGRSLDSPTHPRAYGSFARVLGHYTRELGVLTLPDAVRKMTSLPASTFGLTDRGVLEPGYAADLVVLDPAAVADRATFADPHQLSVGVRDVVVNGVLALRDGAPTGARPGRRLRRTRLS